MTKPSGSIGAKKIPSTAVPGARVAKAPTRGAASEDTDEVLVQQFTRDLQLVLRHVRGDKREIVGDIDEVGYYGSAAQKLVVLVDKLLHGTAELAAHKKFRLLLEFGDKFYAQQEFRAASNFFYSKIVDAADEDFRGVEHTETVVADGDDRQIRTKSPPPATTPSSEVFIRALFGKAMCAFQVQKRRDPVVRHPGTLEKMLTTLRLLQKGMETATALELAGSSQRFSWLVLNGSLLIFSIARPLSTLGFAHEVVAFLKWTILSLESVVTLCTTKYILWRTQLFAATCECYEVMAFQAAASHDAAQEAKYVKAALSCAEYAQKTVTRLQKEEELDMPVPKDVVAVLSQAQAVARMLVARAKAATSHEVLSKRQIEAAFASSSVAERIRIAVDMIESLARSDRESAGVLAPPSTPQLSEQIGDLLDYVLEVVTPMLPTAQVGSGDESAASSVTPPAPTEPLQLVFPLAFHMMVLAPLWRLGKIEQLGSLVEAARARLLLASEMLSDLNREQCRCELDLFRALINLKPFVTSRSDQAGHQAASEPAHSLKMIASKDTLVAPRVLLRLAKALTSLLTHASGTMRQTKRDLVLAAAMVLWREGAQPIVEKLDASELSGFPKQLVKVAAKLLLAIHLALTCSDAEDLLLHGLVGIRLASMLRLCGKYRLATQTIRALLERIDRKRDELALFENHFEATTAATSEDDARNAVAMSCATISCDVDHTLSRSDASARGGDAAMNACDRVGVLGTGSQFGSARHDICCLQADLLLLLFQIELEEASAVDALPTSTGSDQPTSPFEVLSLVKLMEEKLSLECRKNGYCKVFLLIQRMRHHPSQARENTALADQALKLVARVEAHERELRTRVKELTLGSKISNESTGADGASSAPSDANVMLPPVVVSRSSTAITVRVLEFQPTQPSLRKRAVAYYMVFAKPSGAGTDVSLNNNSLPGTAEPVYPSSQRMEVTVGGLIPNESYVFAAAAFDSSHEVIHGVGQTSDPVVALHPLPVALCYGYLAQACYELHLLSSATKAATALYSQVVSKDAVSRVLWKASPFYRHSLKRNVVAKLPLPVLNLVVQAILIMCHDEVGDVDRDGVLHDPDQRSLLSKQVAVLEACKKVAIGVELASAAANNEAIRVLCFKGYRLLLPLLHLHQCDGLTFAPLMMFYQALLTIPSAEWDVDTKSIFARIAFELLRIVSATRVFEPVVYPSLVNETLHHTDRQQEHVLAARSNELQSMCEVIAVMETLKNSSQPPGVAVPQAAPSASATKSAPASKVAAPAASASSPESTPRLNGTDGESTLPPLKVILQQANFSLSAALSALETQATATAPSDIRHIEYVCKLAFIALRKGDESAAEECLAAVKLKGDMSVRFRDALTALGGERMLPERVDAATADEQVSGTASPTPGSAPSTARSAKTPRQSGGAAPQKTPAKDDPGVEVEIEAGSLLRVSVVTNSDGEGDQEGRDDGFLFLWGGEVFFLQSLVQVS